MAAVTWAYGGRRHLLTMDERELKLLSGRMHSTGRTGRQLSVSLPKLAAGRYTVIWHVTSIDTHKTEGHFNFRVSP